MNFEELVSSPTNDTNDQLHLHLSSFFFLTLRVSPISYASSLWCMYVVCFVSAYLSAYLSTMCPSCVSLTSLYLSDYCLRPPVSPSASSRAVYPKRETNTQSSSALPLSLSPFPFSRKKKTTTPLSYSATERRLREADAVANASNRDSINGSMSLNDIMMMKWGVVLPLGTL